MDQARVILHVDMDAFFASVEQRDDPALQGRAVVIAGLGRRGVVSTCSYEARPFGVRSAMPTAEAKRRCPDAVFLPPRMERYAEVSAQVFEVLREITPVVEGLSLDEAFLDVGQSRRLFGTARDMAKRIKQGVLEQTGLTCSVGISHNKWLAKLATELGKPDGLYEISADTQQQVLDPLSVGRMWTVGKVAQAKLEAAGYRRIGDLRASDEAALHRIVGNHSRLLLALARGEDHRPVISSRDEQSIGAETTFERDVDSLSAARAILLKLTERVAARTRQGGLQGRVVTIKLRTPPFHTETRQRTLSAPTQATDELLQAANGLLELWWRSVNAPKLRLLGVSVSQFEPVSAPADLFADKRAPEKDRVVDALNSRFGAGALRRARGMIAPD